MSTTVLVVGATGIVGGAVCGELAARGIEAKRLSRSVGDARSSPVVAAAARGVDAIVDCAGASCAIALGHGWRGYRAVDVPIGLACIAAAHATGARLVYVAAFHAPALAAQPYIAAHETVASAVLDGGGSVIRPTGLYAIFASLRSSPVLVDVGPGTARTNPIDERDLARVLVDAAVGSERHVERDAGGPDIYTRRELFALLAGGRRVVRVPTAIAALGARALSVVHPRLGQFARFGAALARHDAIAPRVGTRTLASYLDNLAPVARVVSST